MDIRNGLVLDVDFRGYSPRDKSVYGNILTNFGSIWTPRGRVFDGVDDYIDCGNKDNLDITNTITIESYTKLHLSQSQTIIAKGSGTTTQYIIDTFGANNPLRFFGYESDVVKGITANASVLNVGIYYHIVGTFNGIVWKIYINGIEDISKTQSANLTVTTQSLTIGSRGTTVYWNGLINKTRIWNRALTTMEINQLYLEFRKKFRI